MTVPQPGALYLVSTPIGNLGDITLRALDVLRAASGVLAEDTRRTRQLLDHFGIATPMEAYHEHNEAKATPRLLERLQGGASLALVSDAGTPLVSDPGARLVRAAVEAGIRVIPIPGASAVLAALVASGLAGDAFSFYGFLDRRGRDRRAVLGAVAASPHAAVLYESPNRTGATLAELAALGAGAREAAVARELTKQFEEVRRGTVADLARYYEDSPPRGEVVIVIDGAPAAAPDEEAMRERARELRAGGSSARDVARALAEEFGAPRNLAYRLAQDA